MPSKGKVKVKKIIKKTDTRRTGPKDEKEATVKIENIPYTPSFMFFKYNSSLKPPYNILLDTNFIKFSLDQKVDLMKGMIDCLYATCKIYITDCVFAELEKLGRKHRTALAIARDPSFHRLKCSHRGIYADDCILERITLHRCYIVATCDRELKKKIRQIDGVPIMSVARRCFRVEQLPEGYGVMG
eukprot:GHVP01031464.1.p1 GENE.GHVP01031464.1~~GHVP01031464.1.p1  ORF type:complete len:186 (+),score=30.25 GHVP01031464.1:485-1042(+)